MNRRVPNGAWCLFRMNPVGSRQGRIVVAQHRRIEDPDLGGSYTVKLYESVKKVVTEDSWEHESITLKPVSNEPQHMPMTFDAASAAESRVIAELVAVLHP